ncbi:phenazine biosynthesis protein [Neosynechococcus sphagnicola sy1]|uniref:Phenazine biosynthesis protein n=1 Tax=Neosynechococcus sphagnicola sy1 TaxID=1497020 RepID=A0A098TL30_9CYAN|nr:PhzF family phenazine biosynthesis protein [Neosynechococcus sphagnicola]KGF72552.1 phenazine biosynthesis protein [Neosynechococcus sphagnicola sy1]
MSSLTFYIVDVFAETKYTGNQLAVFTGSTGDLSDAQMQQIAREINYSETTFILSTNTRNGGYDVRIFTPQTELPFAGHPTLGTAFILQQEILQTAIATLSLNLKVGQIPVSFDYGTAGAEVVWMQQPAPTFGQILDPAAIAAALGLNPAAIDPRFPIQEVSTGVPFIIVPLQTQADLKAARVNRELYFQQVESLTAKEVLLFCPQTYDPANTLSVRVFADYLGIPEDPATGSANGCLAGYLVNYRYWGDTILDIRVEQGHEINRPSLLLLKAQQQATAEITVLVGGRVLLIARGEFL